MKRILIGTDFHLKEGDDPVPAYLLFKKFMKDWKPDLFLNLGDVGDWDFISVFSKGVMAKLNAKSFRGEYDVIERELDYWQKYSKKVVLLSGNHDERVYATIDRNTTLKGLVEYENMLKLGERGVDFYRDTQQPYQIGKLWAIHGWYYNQNHAKKHLDVFSGNIVYGHLHASQTASKVLAATKQEIQAWSLPCLCDKAPEYMNGSPSGWQHGFAVAYLSDTGDFNLYPVNIIKDRFIFEGKEWK
jgi:predicted phosphodiesterase